MKSQTLKLLFVLLASSISLSIFAGPEGGVVGVITLRPYTGASGIAGAPIYMQVDSAAFCATDMFVIDTGRAGGKEAYAAALVALATGKKVRLEVDACNGWGTAIRSLYLTA